MRWIQIAAITWSATTAAFPVLTRCESAEDPARPPAIVAENVPAIPPELAERLRQFQELRGAAFRGWSPDGNGILISTRFGETSQLHRVTAPGSRREQITFYKEPVSGGFLPRSKSGEILFSMARGGDENGQIYRLDRETGRATLLTDGKSRNLLQAVQRSGARMVVGSNQRNGRDTDLYLADPRKPSLETMLLKVSGEFWSALDWSPDNDKLLLGRYVSANESYGYWMDVATGEKHAIEIPGAKPSSLGALAFSHDGSAIYLTTDARGEFTELARFDPANGGFTWFTSEIPWDVDEVEVSEDADRVAFTTNEDGSARLYLLEAGKLQPIATPVGIIGSLEFSPDGKHLGFTLARATAPPDAWSVELQTGRLTQWTFSEVGGLDTETFIEPRPIRFEAADGRPVPAWYYRPRQASATRPVAVLIDIHGGPESQYRPSLSGVEQFYLTELGIAVIHPNVRGSAGYGKTWLKLDNAEKREDSVRDIGALLDWIAKQPELDSKRVGVIGGSYGGYMVLASLVHYGDRLKAGIDIVGIASFKSFLKNTSAYRQDLRRAEYGDERDAAMLAAFERIDPINHVDKITSALMVVHGKNDPRVPFSEAEQIVAGVRAAGRPAWAVFADNEGHGFAKKPNRDYLTAAVVLFLQEHLLGANTKPAESAPKE